MQNADNASCPGARPAGQEAGPRAEPTLYHIEPEGGEKLLAREKKILFNEQQIGSALR
jgi:hypothetical protein